MKKSRGEKIFQVFNYCLITFLALICLYPFWHVAMASVSETIPLMKHTGVLLKPAGFSLEAYKIVLSDIDIYYGFKNTAFLLIVGVPLGLILTSIGAYFFSRKGVYFKKPIFLFCIFTMYVSGGTIPFYLTLKDLHLTGTLWGVVLGFALSTYNMIILRTAFDSIPESLSEAARIDGAGHFTILFKVILPLAKASLAVIALYYGVSIWNGWFWSSTILRDPKKYPLQVVLRNMIITETGGGDTELLTLETVKYATIMVSVVPILLIYPVIQKHFTQGVMIGAVKE